MAERNRIPTFLADALSFLSPGTSSPENNNSWADRPSISSQQQCKYCCFVALPDPVRAIFKDVLQQLVDDQTHLLEEGEEE